MLNFFKKWFPEKGPLAYRVPLDWFEAQLPGDLLSTGLYWVWESSRGFKGGRPTLPESRSMTVLTPELAGALSAEIGEYYLEAHREVTAFATAGPMVLSAEGLQQAIRAFASKGAGPLVAVLYQPSQGAAEVFLPQLLPDPLARLLGTWAERLGKPVDKIERVPGGAILKRIFLNSEALKNGAIKAFPPFESTGRGHP